MTPLSCTEGMQGEPLPRQFTQVTIIRKCFAAPGLVCIAISIASAPASAGCTLRLMAQFPVTLIASQAPVVARIDGVAAPVLLDTGARFNLLSYDAAARLHLRWHVSRGQVSGVGGVGDTLLAVAAANVGLGIAHVTGAEFIIASLPRGAAAGFIGRNILDRYDIDYDLPVRVIKLFQPGGCEGVPLAYWARSRQYSMAQVDPGDAQTVIGYVNGIEMRILFDTAASTTILDTAAASRAGVTPQSPGAMQGGVIHGAAGRPVKTWLVPVRSVRIVNEEIHGSLIRIGTLALPNVEMVLGTDFFLSHHVYLANGQRRIYFTYEGGPVFAGNAPPRNGR